MSLRYPKKKNKGEKCCRFPLEVTPDDFPRWKRARRNKKCAVINTQEASFDLEKLYSLYVARFESRRANYHRFISYHLSFFFFLKISPRSLANLFFSIVYTPRKRKFSIFTIASSAFLAAAAFWLFINMRPTAGGLGAYPRPHQNSSRMWGNFLSSLSLFSNFQVRSAANFCFKSEV